MKENLSVDVRNESITGGSFRGSIAHYIVTGQYAEAKPKLVIWELSAHYGLDQRQTFREIIPALYGVCSETDAVVSGAGDLESLKTVLFDDLVDRKISSSRYYLYLELSDKMMRAFKIRFIYHDRNEADVFKVKRRRKNFPENNGVFFVELRSAIDEPLHSVVIEGEENLSGSYVAKICQVPVPLSKI